MFDYLYKCIHYALKCTVVVKIISRAKSFNVLRDILLRKNSIAGIVKL